MLLINIPTGFSGSETWGMFGREGGGRLTFHSLIFVFQTSSRYPSYSEISSSPLAKAINFIKDSLATTSQDRHGGYGGVEGKVRGEKKTISLEKQKKMSFFAWIFDKEVLKRYKVASLFHTCQKNVNFVCAITQFKIK